MFFCAAGIGLHAQSVFVKTDRNQILIGEPIEYELTLSLPEQGYSINVKLPDSIPHFDVIANKDFDTVSSSGSFLVNKKIIFTSFDSGAWRIPSFEVELKKNDISSKFNTDSILVNVGYSPTDSTAELRDIKPVMEVTVTDYFWYYVEGTALALIIIIVLLVRYLKNKPAKPATVFHSALSPYDEAIKALQELKENYADKPEQIKSFYVSLAEIFKKYYSRKQGKNMMNKTTDGILVNIKEHYADPALLSTLAEALRCADAVKFAKYIPGRAESDQRHEQVKTSIELIEKDRSQQKQ